MDEHSITPPPELVQEWATVNGTHYEDLATLCRQVAIQASQWGADQELEACCDTLQRHAHWDLAVCELMAARRPKPPSLAEQALKELTDWTDEKHGPGGEVFLCEGLSVIRIRRALERLQELEGTND